MATKISSYEEKQGVSINSIKAVVLNYGAKINYNDRINAFCAQMKDEKISLAEQTVNAIAEGNFGFASDIAKTVKNFGRISEKQAYWISRAAWENEIPTVFEGLNDSRTYTWHFLVNPNEEEA